MPNINEHSVINISSENLKKLSEEIKFISENSSQVNTLSERARDSADQGERALSDVRSTLESFVESSAKINAFLEEINLLTQQVHILGVNAAIEAASAGKHSGGFSIIAEEMRRIAAKVKETSANIYAVLESSGTLASNTVKAIQAAGETLELLEVSANLSIELSRSISDMAKIRNDDNISRIILGKDEQIRLALTCLVARGHLLIEDLPGVGKTTLAHAIAQVMGLDFQRIQFTSDLLPADVLGVAVYDRERSVFEFHQGPIFSNFILADEINRATPKTQSALLEAMEESQVTVDGETRDLPQPFFVIATQNPVHQIGTYALPESQLDRFLMRLHLGFPDREAERELLQGEERRDMIEHIKPVLDGVQLISIQKQAAGIHVADALLDYVQSLLEFTRNSPMFEFGLSPRGGLALLNSARALALIDGREFVLPEHIKQVLPAVVNHRLVNTSDELEIKKQTAADFISASVPVP